MKITTLFTLLILMFHTPCISQEVSSEVRNLEFFKNGKFNKIDKIFISNGKFTFKEPSVIDTVIDLKDKFVIPPFTEAHTHKLDLRKEFYGDYKRYLEEGTFNVMVLNNRATLVQRNREVLDSLQTLKVLYANGGITTTGAHPSFVYERDASGIEQWWLPENTEKIKVGRLLKNDAYWFFDTIEDVNNQWNEYLSSKPDFVKIYILDSAGGQSLKEEVISHICNLSHKEGLKVFAHIETFEDLKLGLRTGVDVFAHLPYYNINFQKQIPKQPVFTKEELDIIKQKNVAIISTLSLNEDNSIVRTAENNFEGVFDSVAYRRASKFHCETVNHLRQKGFKFAIGSDSNSTLKEIKYWFKNNILPNSEILEIATYQTRNLFFPNNALNDFSEGSEASFLVLNGNPLLDFNYLEKIDLMFKKGNILNGP